MNRNLHFLERRRQHGLHRRDGPIVLRVIADAASSVADRQLAMVVGAEIMNEELAVSIADILENPAEPDVLRACAAGALAEALQTHHLGYTAHDRINATLQQLYFDETAPRQLRRTALQASVHSPQPWHSDAIRSAFHRADPEWQRTAAQLLYFVPDCEDVVLEALQSPTPSIRNHAVRAAGKRPVRAAWPYIEEMLRTPPAKKQAHLTIAIDAAADIWPERAEPMLSRLSDEKECDPGIREAAHHTLRRIEAERQGLPYWPGIEDDLPF